MFEKNEKRVVLFRQDLGQTGRQRDELARSQMNLGYAASPSYSSFSYTYTVIQYHTELISDPDKAFTYLGAPWLRTP